VAVLTSIRQSSFQPCDSSIGPGEQNDDPGPYHKHDSQDNKQFVFSKHGLIELG